MTKSPCKDCESRKVGCHSQCEKYLNFRDEYEKQKKTIRENKDAIMKKESYLIDAVRRVKKFRK